MGRSKKMLRGKPSPPSSFKFLPSELVTEILSWLPAKALITFSTVCKPWNSLIRSPSFIIKSSNRSLLLLPTDFGQLGSEKFCSILCDENTLAEHEKFVFPRKSTPDWLGNWSLSCNGLICLTNYTKGTLYLYNPSIRKVRSVCSSSIGGRDYVAVGCGCDKFSGEFKLVRILKNVLAPPEAEVYNIRSGCWRRIEDVPDFYGGLSATCNGAVHWRPLGIHKSRGAIISFDLSEEVFREMELPEGARSKHGFVMSFNGSLSLFVNNSYSGSAQYRQEERVEYEIWVMREYGVAESWTKELAGVVEGIRNWAFGCTKGGKLVFQKSSDGMLALWDPKTLQLEDLGFHGNSYKVFDYVETLALIED